MNDRDCQLIEYHVSNAGSYWPKNYSEEMLFEDTKKINGHDLYP